MNNSFLIILFSTIFYVATAQQNLSPKQLLELNRVFPVGITKNLESVVYGVSKYNLKGNVKLTKYYLKSLDGGEKEEIEGDTEKVADKHVSPDGKKRIVIKNVKINKVSGQDYYPELKNTDVKIYESLQYRHWDKWEDGEFSHVFIEPEGEGEIAPIDIMFDEPYNVLKCLLVVMRIIFGALKESVLFM